jgi:5'-methylthioadenosine phosphorylase
LISSENTADIGIIGGTGVYDPEIFEEVKEIKVYTPFGETSDLVSIGDYKGIKVAFIPRHGRGHSIPPHKINYRANIWAFKQLGVSRIIASSAVGSLREEYKRGDFVIPDQFIDRTKKRLDTFYEGGQLCHISSADPFCPQLREFFIDFTRHTGLKIQQRGTYVCIEGPRFSTRAESKLFRLWNAHIIGMTVYPECMLAREAELCYVSVAMVTDYDVWAEKPVSAREIIKTMGESVEKFKKMILNAIPKIPKERECSCAYCLKDALV